MCEINLIPMYGSYGLTYSWEGATTKCGKLNLQCQNRILYAAYQSINPTWIQGPLYVTIRLLSAKEQGHNKLELMYRFLLMISPKIITRELCRDDAIQVAWHTTTNIITDDWRADGKNSSKPWIRRRFPGCVGLKIGSFHQWLIVLYIRTCQNPRRVHTGT